MEALKIQRQKRIAARGSSIPAKSPLTSHKTRKQLPAKLSPGSHKGSKFSDIDPGSSSPLKRSSIRSSLVVVSDSQEASKPSRLSTGSHSAGNRLSRIVSPLPEPKKENSSVIADSNASMARIRRLSEPKMGGSHHGTSVKSQSAESVSKAKISVAPEIKKISAIMNHDRSKAATLPELKIKKSKGPDVAQSKSAAKEPAQNCNGNKSSTTAEGAEVKRNHENYSHRSDGDDNPVIEKTVLMLECEKPSIPTAQAKEGNLGAHKGQYDNFKIGKKVELAPDYAVIRAPVSPLKMDKIDGESSEHQFQEQHSSFEVWLVN